MRTLAALFCLLPWLTLAQVPVMPGGAVPWYKLQTGDGDTNIPPILWWKLNEGTGTDIAGSASNGGDGGTTDSAWVTGESGSGYSLSFSGSTYAQTTNNITFDTNILTVCFWLKPTDITTTQGIIGNYDNVVSSDANPLWGIYVSAGKLYCVSYGTTGHSWSTYLTLFDITDVWTHCAFAFTAKDGNSGGWMKFWTNAVNRTPTSSNATLNTGSNFCATNKVEVGSRGNGTLIRYTGVIDDVRIFKGELSGAEITNIYLHPK